MRAPDLEASFDSPAIPLIDKPASTEHARAWKIPTPEPGQGRPDWQASCRTWVVNGPWHPFWKWWMVAAIHLRDIPGVPPAHKTAPNMTHQLMIVSLNPERGEPDIEAIDRGDDWGDKSKSKFLTPPDVCRDFEVRNDLDAAELCDAVVGAIMRGRASPDSDWRSWWNDVIDTTAEHYRDGLHDEEREETT